MDAIQVSKTGNLTGTLVISPEGWQKLWRPIETAPKDAKPILVYERWDETGMTKVGSYADGKWLSWPGPHELKPTHWMPLPAGPK